MSQESDRGEYSNRVATRRASRADQSFSHKKNSVQSVLNKVSLVSINGVDSVGVVKREKSPRPSDKAGSTGILMKTKYLVPR